MPIALVTGESRGIDRATAIALGRIDALVNNAYDHSGNDVPLQQLTPELMERNLRSNAVGPLLSTALALPAMAQQGAGRIINMISVTAYTDPSAPVGEGG
jgi:NAD(P)-dependent dehydrogenase (short-subunit alcohol dehydrogenase family)